MTPLPVLNGEGATVGRAPLADEIAATPIKQHLIHETVVAELAARRAGTHSTRTRGQVSGGGSKPWRQKGTGRARQGSTRAPQWAGGGIVFGPTPRSYGGKVNRKVRRQALRATLRAHADRGSLAVADPIGWETPSTRAAVEYLRQAPEGLQVRPLLLVVEDVQSVEARAFRNIAGVYILAASEIEVADLVAARALLVERAVWERLAGELSGVEAVEPELKPAPAKKRAAKVERTPVPPAEEQAPPAEAAAEEPEAAEEPVADIEAAEEPVADIEAAEEPVAEEPEAEISDEELEAEALAAASEPEGGDDDQDDEETKA
ncbi:MAG: 50S ribosomal protein L4 [Thermoleophilia bacterium]